MSHIVTKQCAVTDLELLAIAAIALGAEVVYNEKPRYYGTGGRFDESIVCDMVIKLPGRYDMGVLKQSNGTYSWVCDGELLTGDYGRGSEGRKMLGENAEKLMTQYGSAAVERDILAGAVYRTTVEPDGSIVYEVEESELERLGYQVNS